MSELDGLLVLSDVEGVIMKSDFVVVLELDRECCFVSRGSAKGLFVIVLVIAHNQYLLAGKVLWNNALFEIAEEGRAAHRFTLMAW